MMKYEARYEEFVNKRYKEPEDGNFEDATREIFEAVSGDSNIGDDEKMEHVAAIATHLAYIISYNPLPGQHGPSLRTIIISDNNNIRLITRVSVKYVIVRL